MNTEKKMLASYRLSVDAMEELAGMVHCGSAAPVATALGHSESVLQRNYLALVTKADAERFWSL